MGELFECMICSENSAQTIGSLQCKLLMHAIPGRTFTKIQKDIVKTIFAWLSFLTLKRADKLSLSEVVGYVQARSKPSSKCVCI